MNEAAALQYDPFSADFGSPSDKTLSDKMVTARKGGECHHCGQSVQPGTRIRAMSAVIDGTLHSHRWCNACCEAMAASWYDDGAALDARFALRGYLPTPSLER